MAVTPLRPTWCRKPWRCARTRAARFVRLKLCCPWVCRAETRPKAVFFRCLRADSRFVQLSVYVYAGVPIDPVRCSNGEYYTYSHLTTTSASTAVFRIQDAFWDRTTCTTVTVWRGWLADCSNWLIVRPVLLVSSKYGVPTPTDCSKSPLWVATRPRCINYVRPWFTACSTLRHCRRPPALGAPTRTF